MKIDLSQRISVVTGGSNGIGRAISLALAKAGSDIAVNYYSDSNSAEELKSTIEDLGRRAMVIQADVANYDAVAEMMKMVKREWGKIDILVNNAGITKDSLLMRMTVDDWSKVINTNLTGVFNCSKAVVIGMMRHKSGKIVNISSVSGLTGMPGQVNYSSSKGGINAFTKALAKELAILGINVNAITPGFIESRIIENLPEKERNTSLQLIPLGRFGKTEEVANLALFLVSDHASYITGQIINIDGGIYM